MVEKKFTKTSDDNGFPIDFDIQVQVLSLNTMTLEINTQNVYTKLGVAVSVTGIAQVSGNHANTSKNKAK